MAQQIKTLDDLKAVIKEALPELVREHPQVFIDAMASNKDAMVQSLRAAGLEIVDPAAASTRAMAGMYREGLDAGVIVGGFGARIRSQLESRTVRAADGRTKQTYLHGDAERMATEWVVALMNGDKEGVRAATDRLNKATVRAPSTPMTHEPGTGGGFLVPLVIAAEIFQEMNERFVLQNRVQVFVSDAPLQIPRRISQVTVSRGAPASDLAEKDFGATLGAVKLAPERVGALAYIEPRLANAAAVGPVRWVIGQIAEAMAKDLQRVIVAGNIALREPRGINTLPTSGGNEWDRAKTATWDDTSRASRRDSVRELFYAIAQPHRESDAFLWITNNDGVRVLASLNDMDQRPFEDASNGRPARFMGKEIVESSAIATSGSATTIVGGDMNQYAYVESSEGLRIEQTTVGGQAWVSDTIGIKAIQHYDGAPVIPPAFGKLDSVTV